MGSPKRAKLDLVSMPREDVEHILDSFDKVPAKTKGAVLERFDSLGEAMRRCTPYVSPLDPPPGDPRQAHTGDRSCPCGHCGVRPGGDRG